MEESISQLKISLGDVASVIGGTRQNVWYAVKKGKLILTLGGFEEWLTARWSGITEARHRESAIFDQVVMGRGENEVLTYLEIAVILGMSIGGAQSTLASRGAESRTIAEIRKCVSERLSEMEKMIAEERVSYEGLRKKIAAKHNRKLLRKQLESAYQRDSLR